MAPKEEAAAPQKRTRAESPKPKAAAAASSKAGESEKKDSETEKVAGGFRWKICYLLFGCRLVCQVNRILLGSLLPEIRKEVSLSESQAGQLLSAFASGYMLTQILGGWLADKLGGKWILQLAICAVSLGSLVAPFAIDIGFWPGYITYFAMGLMEGPSFPTSGSMLSKWIPAKERSRAASLADTGGSIGGLLALGGGSVLSSLIGWRPTFFLYGLVSSGFCVAWLVLSASRPSESAYVSEEEMKMLVAEGVVDGPGKGSREQAEKAGAGKKAGGFPVAMFLQWPVIAVCFAHSVFNFGRYFLYGWIPTFYKQVLGVPAVTAGFYMTLLQVADAFVKLLVAPFADSLVSSGKLSILGLRRLLSCSGFIGFGIGLCLCCLTSSPLLVTAALIVAKSFASCHAAGFKTNYLDISKKHTGSISGVGNTFATLSSTVAPLLAGSIIEWSGWNAMFFTCFLVNLSGALVFGFFSSATNLDPVEKED
eukprot:TRINITY_DN30927_c0_g1_i1.p1 TRINITY_DN30927_c0_g1~~TRINITY_DN30927_c0_g1_i1.p1  ORF type:complete len:498 (+),score=94.51 TRINITY_DN30927_c0_g1_i1:54-1496(+)